MKFFQEVTMSVVLSLVFFGAAVAQEPKADTLPPEKTQLIYDTLLPSKADENEKKFEVKDAPSTTMNVKMVAQILRGKGIDLQGKEGQWQFFYDGMQIFLLTDPNTNRIRMMTPLAKLDQLRQDPNFREVELLQKMLRANYLATGDIRLCMKRHIIWAAFLHPLDSLTERDFVNAFDELTEIVRKSRHDLD